MTLFDRRGGGSMLPRRRAVVTRAPVLSQLARHARIARS